MSSPDFAGSQEESLSPRLRVGGSTPVRGHCSTSSLTISEAEDLNQEARLVCLSWQHLALPLPLLSFVRSVPAAFGHQSYPRAESLTSLR